MRPRHIRRRIHHGDRKFSGKIGADFFNPGRIAKTIENDVGTFVGKCPGNAKTDAGGGPCHQHRAIFVVHTDLSISRCGMPSSMYISESVL